MKLKEKMKRFAAAVLSMTMALTCMSLCAQRDLQLKALCSSVAFDTDAL